MDFDKPCQHNNKFDCREQTVATFINKCLKKEDAIAIFYEKKRLFLLSGKFNQQNK